MLIRHRHCLLILAGLFSVWFVALAIHPLGSQSLAVGERPRHQLAAPTRLRPGVG